MLYLKELNKRLKDPNEELEIEEKKILYDNLSKGHIFFEFPKDLGEHNKDIKTVKIAYKTGLIYDFLTKIYPLFSKKEKYHIISDNYHMLFTYRQFSNVLSEYEKNRKKYIYFRSLLECT